jgi:hypothetical protein
VLNFHHFDKGYSLGFNIKSNDKLEKNMNQLNGLNSLETKLLPYEETEFLFYVNSGQIPPILIDLIDRINVCYFFITNLFMN